MAEISRLSSRTFETIDVIDDRLLAWADALRITGNEAAHGAEFSVKREDAKDALDFTEAIVDYLFVFQERFKALKPAAKVRRRSVCRRPHSRRAGCFRAED